MKESHYSDEVTLPAPDGVNAMRQLFGSAPSPVAIVTAMDSLGVPYGLTCNALSSVSLDPAMLLVCLSHYSRTLRAILATESFAVNFLAADGAAIAHRFATSMPNKFSGVRYTKPLSEVNAPVLSEAVVGWIVCRVQRVINAADHAVILGEAVHTKVFDQPSLLYFQRGYIGWPARPATDTSSMFNDTARIDRFSRDD